MALRFRPQSSLILNQTLKISGLILLPAIGTFLALIAHESLVRSTRAENLQSECTAIARRFLESKEIKAGTYFERIERQAKDMCLDVSQDQLVVLAFLELQREVKNGNSADEAAINELKSSVEDLSRLLDPPSGAPFTPAGNFSFEPTN
jgi:hypothetical protein